MEINPLPLTSFPRMCSAAMQSKLAASDALLSDARQRLWETAGADLRYVPAPPATIQDRGAHRRPPPMSTLAHQHWLTTLA